MRGHFLILIFGMLVMSANLGFGQLVVFCYHDDGNPPQEPPITYGNGQAVPDGTPIFIMQDLGETGPDPIDGVLATFGFNGEEQGLGVGYFVSESFGFEVGTTVYLAIGLPDICWYTVDCQIIPGYQERCFLWNEWTSTEQPCPWMIHPPAIAAFYYCPEPNDPVLGCPCENGGPFPDGVVVCFFHDVNLNGPDDADTTLMCAASHYEGNCWEPDGPLFISEPGAGRSVYLMVNGGACCWTTMDYLVVGYLEIWIAGTDWSCADTSCEFLRAGDPAQVPKGFRITSVYPNPFNSVTQIELTVPNSGMVQVEIYNVTGQRVRTLAHYTFSAGLHRLTWDARSDANLPVGSGLYFCRATSHGSSVTRKLLLLQ